jgi:succinyldiaminopimelate transaminase
MRSWALNHLGASGDFDVLPLIGSKELVAWLPTILESKKVLIPEVAYPTYNVGAIIASAQAITVPIDAAHWPAADLAWINSPSNPTGQVHSDSEIESAISWSRKNQSVLVSDECYLDFGDSSQGRSVLAIAQGNNTNLLAVHSLSKRSSMAGYRGAILIGDPKLIATIREFRKHAGMMVPLPVQNAMVVALGDETHVEQQRARYNNRRALLAPALVRAGFSIHYSHAGLYIWCTRNEDAWKSVGWLAELGILATPGSFYGEKGASHIRVALTATDEQIADAVQRIESAVK